MDMLGINGCQHMQIAAFSDGRCLTAGQSNCEVRLEKCGGSHRNWQTWSMQMLHEEAKDESPMIGLVSARKGHSVRRACKDEDAHCAPWSAAGECTANPAYMYGRCPESCGVCQKMVDRVCSRWAVLDTKRSAGLLAAEAERCGVRIDKSPLLAPVLSLTGQIRYARHGAHPAEVVLANWSRAFGGIVQIRMKSRMRGNMCLASGLWSLGASANDNRYALWHRCDFPETQHYPFQLWRVTCVDDSAAEVEDTADDASFEADRSEDARTGSDSSGFARVAAMLERLYSEGGEPALSSLPTWEVLGFVSPPEDEAKVKHAVRVLSRRFHPDKNDDAHAPAVFRAVQRAAHDLRNPAAAREAARQQRMQAPFYSTPLIRHLDRRTLPEATESDETLWLIEFYTPWCKQSLAVRAHVALAATALAKHGVSVGAVRCSADKDSMHFCREQQVPETPSFRAVARDFVVDFEPSLPQPLLPELLVNFSLRAQDAFRQQRFLRARAKTLLPLDVGAARGEAFVKGVQLVVFGTNDCPVCEEARGMASYLGPPLLHVYAANCSRLAGTDAAGTERRNASNDGPDGEGDDNASAGDLCILEGVRWAPEVKLYPSGSGLGRGLSLLGRPFASTDQMGAALEAAKTTAQFIGGRGSQALMAVYASDLANQKEDAPEMNFEVDDEQAGGENEAARSCEADLELPRIMDAGTSTAALPHRARADAGVSQPTRLSGNDLSRSRQQRLETARRRGGGSSAPQGLLNVKALGN